MEDQNEKPKITPQIQALQRAALEDPDIQALSTLGDNITIPKEIKTAEQYEAAALTLVTVKDIMGKIEENRVIRKKPFMDASNAVQAHFKALSTPLLEQESKLKGLIRSYIQEVERKRREDEAKAEERARKEREKLEERAQKAQDKGQLEKAEHLADEADAVVAEAPISAPKAEGVSTVKVWKWKLKDKKDMNKAYMEPDTKKIDAMVKASPEDAAEMIGGIEVYQDTQVRAKRG